MRALLKAEDYEATSWHDSEEGASERTLTYRVPLNANLGPKWAEVIEKQVTCWWKFTLQAVYFVI